MADDAPQSEPTSSDLTRHLKIKGMHCGACVARIEKALKSAFPDLKTVSVDLVTETVTLKGEAPERAISEVLKLIGYELIVPQPAEAAEASAPLVSALLTEETLSNKKTTFKLSQFGWWSWVPQTQEFWHTAGFTFFMLNSPFGFFTFLICTVFVARIAWPVWQRGFLRLVQGTPDMESLITLGTAGTYFYSGLVMFWPGLGSLSTCFESVGLILLFYFFGKALERQILNRTADGLDKLFHSQALAKKDRVRVKNADGILMTPLASVYPNHLVQVLEGDILPVDGLVSEGEGHVDESMWTGESDWVLKRPGDSVLAGAILKSGTVLVKVSHFPGESRKDQMRKTVENALSQKMAIQRLADYIAMHFVWAILVLTALTVTVELLLGVPWMVVFERGLAMLVVACPCAFGLATPIALRRAASKLVEKGVLLNDIAPLETMGFLKTLFLDKTGTVTQSQTQLGDLKDLKLTLPAGQDEADYLRCLASLEQFSTHPMAVRLQAWATNTETLLWPAALLESEQGKGISGTVTPDAGQFSGDTLHVAIGQPRWVKAKALAWVQASPDFSEVGSWATLIKTLAPQSPELKAAVDSLATEATWTAFWSASHGLFVGGLEMALDIHPSVPEAIVALKDLGIDVVLLSGDTEKRVAFLGHKLGVSYQAQCLPEDKQRVVHNRKQEYVAAAKAGKRPVLVGMVGDGINDTLALAEADVSMAVATGSDWVQSVSSLVITRPDLTVIPWMVRLAKQTRRVIQENFFWACAFNVLCIPMAAMGLLSPMMASAAMSLSSLAVAINSCRARQI